jgi:hypothetical protein
MTPMVLQGGKVRAQVMAEKYSVFSEPKRTHF